MGLNKHIDQLYSTAKDYIKLEAESLKLKAVLESSKSLGTVFAFAFLLVFLIIVLLLSGIWLGFWLSELLQSYILGFGFSSLTFIVAFLILILFRRTLLEKPFANLSVKYLFMNHKLQDEDQE